MSRSIQEWKLWDETTVSQFQSDFLKNFKKRGVVQAAIARELEIDPNRFTKWLNQTLAWDWIGEDKYRLLVDRAARDGIIQIGKALKTRLEYTGIASFFGQDDSNLPALAANAKGDYAVYRFSRFKPGFVLKGGLHIEWNPAERIVSTNERYRAIIDGKEEHWPRSGYLCERSDGRLVIVSRKNAVNEPQIMYLNRPMRASEGLNPEAFTNIDGILIDWQGDSCYAVRAVIDRVSTALTQAQIKDYPPEVIDKTIIDRLMRPITTTPKKTKAKQPFDLMCIFD